MTPKGSHIVGRCRSGDAGCGFVLCRVRDIDSPNPQVQEQIEALEAQLGPSEPAPEERRPLLFGPHRGQLGEPSKRFSVVIVAFNSEATLTTCLSSVLPTLGALDEVILVDNASGDGTVEMAGRFIGSTESGPAVRILPQAENLGYSVAANVGVLASAGKFIALLNPDTEVHEGWLDRLRACLDKGYAAAGPVSDRVSGDQYVKFHLPQGAHPKVEELHSLVSEAKKGHVAETRLLTGFCLMVPRAEFNLYGLLEETTSLGADDLELSWRLRCLGRRLAIATDAFVRHEAGASFKSLATEERTERVAVSDQALVAKMEAFYGPGKVPSSEKLFGSDIFATALEVRRRDVTA